jgi:protein TonB
MTAAAQAVLSPPPPPRAKPTPPAMLGDALAALNATGGTRTPAATETGRTASRDSAPESDMQNGSEGMEGAAPRADNPAPEYPYIARMRGEAGRVVLRVDVLASGAAGKVRVERSSGYDVLDQAALESVKRWRFLPARRNGRPVAATVRVPIRFALQ